jgi:hypothetical protein
MSAQVVTALRLRAEFLDGEADRYEASTAFAPPESRPPAVLRLIAAEFRALADAAEGR